MTQAPAIVHCFGMIEPIVHLIFDFFAWTLGIVVLILERKRMVEPSRYLTHAFRDPYCWFTVLCGTVAAYLAFGGWQFSNLDTIHRSHNFSATVFGALIGLEVYRQTRGLPTSMLSSLVLPLSVAIAITRAGCHQAGLLDAIRGRFTSSDWGWDFGDSVRRYPVQLIESLIMCVFVVGYWQWSERRPRSAQIFGIIVFLFFYASERFILEAYTKYTPFLWQMDGLQWICLGIIGYTLIMLDRREGSEPAYD